MTKDGHDKSSQKYTRRELITQVAATSAMAATTIGVGTWLVNRTPATESKLETIKDHRVKTPSGAYEFAIVHGKNPAENVRKALELVGGMKSYVSPGERVVIKPNVGWNRLAEQAANTNPKVVGEVVRQVINAGAKEVIVTDVTVNNADRCFARSGIAEVVKKNGAKLVLHNKSGFRTVDVSGQLIKVADVLWPFIEADKIINLPIVKQHSLCTATMSMKNWYGVLGGHRVRLHQDIHRSIVDLTLMMKSTLTVLDATNVLMNNGPSGGSLDDVKKFDTIAVSTNEVALDAFGLTFLGSSKHDVEYVQLAEALGLGISDYQSLKLVEIAG